MGSFSYQEPSILETHNKLWKPLTRLRENAQGRKTPHPRGKSKPCLATISSERSWEKQDSIATLCLVEVNIRATNVLFNCNLWFYKCEDLYVGICVTLSDVIIIIVCYAFLQPATFLFKERKHKNRRFARQKNISRGRVERPISRFRVLNYSLAP